MAPTAANDLKRQLITAQLDALHVARQAWQEVSPDHISESWTAQLSTLTPRIEAVQVAAAEAGALSVAASVAESGAWTAPGGFVDPRSLAGFASDGRGLDGLLYSPAVGAKHRIANGMPVADAMSAAAGQLAGITSTLVNDAARQSAGIMIVAKPHTGYIRQLSTPSCPRCIILAGKFYRWNDGFMRHPRCDCVHVATTEAASTGLISDPYEAFNSLSKADQDRLFGAANAQAIRDGGDIYQVVNSRRGMSSTGMFTTEGTTRRGYAYNLLADGQQRATPEQIYKWANGDREKALELLAQHGYILPGGQVPGGSIRGMVEGFGQFGRGGRAKAASQVVVEARRTGVRDPLDRYTMTAAERRLYDAEQDWIDVLNRPGRFSAAQAAAVEKRYTEALFAERARLEAISRGQDAISVRAKTAELTARQRDLRTVDSLDELAKLSVDELDELIGRLSDAEEWDAVERASEMADKLAERANLPVKHLSTSTEAFEPGNYKWFETASDDDQQIFLDMLRESGGSTDAFFAEQWAYINSKSAEHAAKAALPTERELRAQYAQLLDVDMAHAREACNGFLLDPSKAPAWAREEDLWKVNQKTAQSWATEELKRYWQEHGRPAWKAFKEQSLGVVGIGRETAAGVQWGV